MVQHVFERAVQATDVAEVVVATDDARIVAAVEGFGGRALLTSPACASGTDRVAEAARTLLADGARFDVVVNLQGDEPFVEPGAIAQVARLVSEDPTGGRAPMATLARSLEPDELDDPSVVKVVRGADGYALYFSRAPIGRHRDDAARTEAQAHLGLYAFSRTFLQTFAALPQTPLERSEHLEQLRALEHGHPIAVGLTRSGARGIDTPEDLVAAH